MLVKFKCTNDTSSGFAGLFNSIQAIVTANANYTPATPAGVDVWQVIGNAEAGGWVIDSAINIPNTTTAFSANSTSNISLTWSTTTPKTANIDYGTYRKAIKLQIPSPNNNPTSSTVANAQTINVNGSNSLTNYFNFSGYIFQPTTVSNNAPYTFFGSAAGTASISGVSGSSINSFPPTIQANGCNNWRATGWPWFGANTPNNPVIGPWGGTNVVRAAFPWDGWWLVASTSQYCHIEWAGGVSTAVGAGQYGALDFSGNELNGANSSNSAVHHFGLSDLTAGTLYDYSPASPHVPVASFWGTLNNESDAGGYAPGADSYVDYIGCAIAWDQTIANFGNRPQPYLSNKGYVYSCIANNNLNISNQSGGNPFNPYLYSNYNFPYPMPLGPEYVANYNQQARSDYTIAAGLDIKGYVRPSMVDVMIFNPLQNMPLRKLIGVKYVGVNIPGNDAVVDSLYTTYQWAGKTVYDDDGIPWYLVACYNNLRAYRAR